MDQQKAPQATSSGEIYGEGFSAVYNSDRYALFSQRLAKLALSLLEQQGCPGRELLDLACGAGAGTVLLAKAGFVVVGIDGSQTMLRCTTQRAEAAGIDIRLFRQDMRTLELSQQFDVVTCLFDALNYLLREDELAKLFVRIAALLRPQGLFVFDLNTLHGLATRWGTRDHVFTARPDLFEANQYRFQEETGINTVTTTLFVRQGTGDLFQRFTEVHRERGYPPETISGLLTAAGLDVISIQGLSDRFQGLSGGLQPLTEDAGRMMVLARRGAGSDATHGR